MDQIQALSSQLRESNREKLAAEERFDEQKQILNGEIEMLQGVIEEMSAKNVVENDIEGLKTQLVTLQEQLERSQLELSIREARPDTSDKEIQTEQQCDSFFRDLTVTPEDLELKQGMIEALEIAEQQKRENQELTSQIAKLKEDLQSMTELYRQTEETLAFVQNEKMIHNDTVDSLSKENSALKDQLRDLSSLSSGINNSNYAADVDTLKAEIAELKTKLANATGKADLENMEVMLVESNKKVSVLELQVGIAKEETDAVKKSLEESRKNSERLEAELAWEQTAHKTSKEKLNQMIKDLQTELTNALFGNQKVNLEHSGPTKQELVSTSVQTDTESKADSDDFEPLSKSQMQALGIEEDSDLCTESLSTDEAVKVEKMLDRQAQELDYGTVKDENESLKSTKKVLETKLAERNIELRIKNDELVKEVEEKTNLRIRINELETQKSEIETDCKNLAITGSKLSMELSEANSKIECLEEQVHALKEKTEKPC